MSGAAQGSRVGTMFGPYRLKRLLGRGGMGEVYEAEHTVKEWTVALKLMSQEFTQNPEFRERMRREAHTAGQLHEPHVVPVHDFGEIDGQLYLEMRLVDGTDLDALLKRFGPLTPPRAVAIIRQVAAALDAAHEHGVMHRDVKPQNILITPDDFAYLVDFGIASATSDKRLTQLGTAVGTWKYMAPERFSDEDVTYRIDIYALACVLYECLTGSPPYRADSASVLMHSHVAQPIPRPSEERPGIPKAFDAVIARGMAKNAQDRYSSAGDLALAAHEALSTPDQDQAATLLEHSQQSTLPATDVAVTLPAPTPADLQQTEVPPRFVPPHQPVWNQAFPMPPQPTPTPYQSIPPHQPVWNQASPMPPQPTPTPYQSIPPHQPVWNRPQPERRSSSRWIILGGISFAVVIAIVVAAVYFLTTPEPTITADQMDSLLLNTGEVNTVMGASNMTGGVPGQKPGTPDLKLSNPDCLGALYPGMTPTYEYSGYEELHYLTLYEPGDNKDHFVDEDVALFKSADKARAFVENQATQWKKCAMQTVTVTHKDNSTVTWEIGKRKGEPPAISQLDSQKGTNSWKCQRALSAVSNVVFDVNACGNGITDQGSRIAEKMAAKVA